MSYGRAGLRCIIALQYGNFFRVDFINILIHKHVTKKQFTSPESHDKARETGIELAIFQLRPNRHQLPLSFFVFPAEVFLSISFFATTWTNLFQWKAIPPDKLFKYCHTYSSRLRYLTIFLLEYNRVGNTSLLFGQTSFSKLEHQFGTP
jgi:hypothetical protein